MERKGGSVLAFSYEILHRVMKNAMKETRNSLFLHDER
jgi:hypothetical protein